MCERRSPIWQPTPQSYGLYLVAVGFQIGDRRSHMANELLATNQPVQVAAQFQVPPSPPPAGKLVDPSVHGPCLPSIGCGAAFRILQDGLQRCDYGVDLGHLSPHLCIRQPTLFMR